MRQNTSTITQTADALSTTLDQVTITADTSTAYTTVYSTTGKYISVLRIFLADRDPSDIHG